MSGISKVIETMDLFDDGHTEQPIRCEPIEDRIKSVVEFKEKVEGELKVITHLLTRHNDSTTLAQAMSRAYMQLRDVDRNIDRLLQQQETEG